MSWWKFWTFKCMFQWSKYHKFEHLLCLAFGWSWSGAWDILKWSRAVRIRVYRVWNSGLRLHLHISIGGWKKFHVQPTSFFIIFLVTKNNSLKKAFVTFVTFIPRFLLIGLATTQNRKLPLICLEAGSFWSCYSRGLYLPGGTVGRRKVWLNLKVLWFNLQFNIHQSGM